MKKMPTHELHAATTNKHVKHVKYSHIIHTIHAYMSEYRWEAT